VILVKGETGDILINNMPKHAESKRSAGKKTIQIKSNFSIGSGARRTNIGLVYGELTKLHLVNAKKCLNLKTGSV
jgi:hypothetical protein